MPVTILERTLIDIAVRPYYVGGPGNVLEAYKAAADQLSGSHTHRTPAKDEFRVPLPPVDRILLATRRAFLAPNLNPFDNLDCVSNSI